MYMCTKTSLQFHNYCSPERGGGRGRGETVDNAVCTINHCHIHVHADRLCGYIYIYVYQVSCILGFPIIDVHTIFGEGNNNAKLSYMYM